MLLNLFFCRLEDYDDLMPIWTRQSETLKETYSEHFLIDLIKCQDEENQAVVCEVSLPWALVLSNRSISDVTHEWQLTLQLSKKNKLTSGR